jgi:hypothetical protein
MVVLRATRKLRTSLPLSPGPVVPSDTALGDWYVNRFVVDRRPLLILLSSRSLLAVLMPARDVRTLPTRLPQVVAARLQRLGVAAPLIRAEVAAMNAVTIATTEDRSVMGTMVDFAKTIPFHLDVGAWDDTTLPFVEARLAETPCHAGGRYTETIWPGDDSRSLLLERWPAA